MNTKDVNVSVETKNIAILKPAIAIGQSSLNERLKSMELTEFCKQAEEYLKDSETKVKMLTKSVMELEKLKTEYIARNKINITNFESLQQAKNELYKYKSQLKSEYIEMEKLFKFRRLKYQKVISSYQSEWQKTLNHYNSDPTVVQLLQIQEENDFLEKEVEKIENLKTSTEKGFAKLKENVEEKFFKKVVEFSKDMVDYRKLSDIQSINDQEVSSEQQQQEKVAPRVDFNFFINKLPTFKTTADDNEEAMCISPLDVSVFDDLSIPTENLETPNEDELYLLIENNMEESGKNADEKTQQENMDVDPKDSESDNQSKNSADNLDAAKEGTQESVEMNEMESQYFKIRMEQQQRETSERRINPQENFKTGNKEEFENNSQMGKLKANEERIGGSEEHPREMQTATDTIRMENEESLSDGSFDNQYGYQSKPLENKQLMACEYNENYDYQFSRTPSVSSDDVSRHTNESEGSPGQAPTEKQPTNIPSKNTQEKEEMKSFSGFFTMDIEDDHQKPSIFKLF